MRESEGLPQDCPCVYTRDSVSFCAYIPGTDFSKGFTSVQTHCDSPVLRLLMSGKLTQCGSFTSVPCEPYSGPVLARWLDRPLRLGGRISYMDADNKLHFKLVQRDNFGMIPSLAPHMLRGTDQKDWVPNDGDYCVCISDPELK